MAIESKTTTIQLTPENTAGLVNALAALSDEEVVEIMKLRASILQQPGSRAIAANGELLIERPRPN